MRNKYSFELESNYEFELKIKVSGWTPARPMPMISDHDHPSYDDAGSNAEYDDAEVFFVVKKRTYDIAEMKWRENKPVEIPMPHDLWKLIEDDLYDDICEAAASHDEADYDSAMEFKRECMEGR